MAKGYKTGGRQAGTPNKLTLGVKEAIQKAFVEVGGEDYLVKVAHENPAVFCHLLSRLLPTHVDFDGSIRNYVISTKPLTEDEWANSYEDRMATSNRTTESTH